MPPLNHLPVVGLNRQRRRFRRHIQHPVRLLQVLDCLPIIRHWIESDLNSLARLPQILTCRSSPEPGHYSSHTSPTTPPSASACPSDVSSPETRAVLADTAPGPLSRRSVSARGTVPGSAPWDRLCHSRPARSASVFWLSSDTGMESDSRILPAFRTARPRTTRRTLALAPCQIQKPGSPFPRRLPLP